jgi:predicted permease
MISDIRFAIRLFMRSPAVPIVVIMSLAVGIGANITAFGIAKAILWDRLPVPEPDRLIAVYNYGPGGNGGYSDVAFREYEYLRDHNTVLSEFAAYLRAPLHMRTSEGTEQANAEIVTPNYLSLLSPNMVLGRASLSSDQAEVVLTQQLWERHFGKDRNIVGTTVFLGGSPFTVIGVVDSRFRGVLMDWGEPPELWISITTLRQALPRFFPGGRSFLELWNAHALMVVGRLKPDRTIEQAQAEFEVLDRQMSKEHPERLKAWQNRYDFLARVIPIQQARFFPAYRGSIISYIEIVAFVMAIVLGIVCLNLANLIMVRSIPRQRELAIRAALGAGRFRLMRQLTVEGLLLSVPGGAGGLLLASWSWSLLSAFGTAFRVTLPADLPLDLPIVAIALGLSVLTGVAFSLLPYAVSSRRRALGFRGALISVQVALSIVLVVGAALLVQTVRNARSVDMGTDRSKLGVLAFDLFGGGETYNNERVQRFFDGLLQQVRDVPGIDGASLVWNLPLTGRRAATSATVTSAGAATPQTVQIEDNVISTSYFDILGIPILRGRDFSDGDRLGAPYVAIINETMAKQFWPGEDPIGREIFVQSAKQNLEIVGVVGDTRGRSVRVDVQPTVFRSAGQFMRAEMTLVFHAPASPTAVFPELRRIVQGIDPNIPILNFRTMQQHVDSGLSQERLMAALLMALGTIALGLTLIGLYSLVAFSAGMRTREIGIRMALGARGRDVMRLVLRQGLSMVIVGIAAGTLLASLLTRMLAAMLFGVQPLDAASFFIAALLITCTTSLAAFVPAWRASRLDPNRALRHE